MLYTTHAHRLQQLACLCAHVHASSGSFLGKFGVNLYIKHPQAPCFLIFSVATRGMLITESGQHAVSLHGDRCVACNRSKASAHLHEVEDALHAEEAQQQDDVQWQVVLAPRCAHPHQLHPRDTHNKSKKRYMSSLQCVLVQPQMI